MKKVLFVVAFENFEDTEYLIPFEILKAAEVSVEVVSNKKGIALGGGRALRIKIRKTINEISVYDYDMIVFVGGMGALDNLNNKISYKIINEAYEAKIIIAAICISPIILSNAGILKNKNATVWLGNFPGLELRTDMHLIQNNANYQDLPVVIDGNIITANGPQSAQQFGEALLSSLN